MRPERARQLSAVRTDLARVKAARARWQVVERAARQPWITILGFALLGLAILYAPSS